SASIANAMTPRPYRPVATRPAPRRTRPSAAQDPDLRGARAAVALPPREPGNRLRCSGGAPGTPHVAARRTDPDGGARGRRGAHDGHRGDPPVRGSLRRIARVELGGHPTNADRHRAARTRDPPDQPVPGPEPAPGDADRRRRIVVLRERWERAAPHGALARDRCTHPFEAPERAAR